MAFIRNICRQPYFNMTKRYFSTVSIPYENNQFKNSNKKNNNLEPVYFPYSKKIIDPNQKKDKRSIQYFSDIHVDMYPNGRIPNVETRDADILAICGNIGDPFHKNFELFLSSMSLKFHTVLFVPGDTDHGYHISNTGGIERAPNTYRCEKRIEEIVSKYSNIVLLDNSTIMIDDRIVVIGSRFWIGYTGKHFEDVKYIDDQVKKYSNNDIIVLTHFPPSYKLMSKEFKKHFKEPTDYHFEYNNCDNLIKFPIVSWISGNTMYRHSNIDTYRSESCIINGILCTTNSYNKYICSNIKEKVIYV